MSTPKSTSPFEASAPIRPIVPHRKPKADLYTVLLVMSLIALLIGILFLYLYNVNYEWKHKGGPAVVMVQKTEGPEIMLLARAAKHPPLYSLIPNP